MKKYLALLWLIALWVSLLWTVNANYDLQIDANNNEVYLLSWDTQITLDNVTEYLTWLDADLNLWLTNTWDSKDTTWDAQDNTWSTVWTWTEISTWDIAWTWDIQDNTWAIAWTWTETSTWTTVDTWTVVSTWRVLGENVEAELLTWDEFDRALYRMYKN